MMNGTDPNSDSLIFHSEMGAPMRLIAVEVERHGQHHSLLLTFEYVHSDRTPKTSWQCDFWSSRCQEGAKALMEGVYAVSPALRNWTK